MLKKVRSYRIIKELLMSESRAKGYGMYAMGSESAEHPLYYLEIGDSRGRNLKDVIISAGIHGEEPAGVYALFNFLVCYLNEFSRYYRFIVFPCINPYGFEHDYRFSAQPDPENSERGMDINRQFKKNSFCREAISVMEVLAQMNRRFVFHIDLHETDPNWADEGFRAEDNPDAFYMWESCPDFSKRIGDKVIAAIASLYPVCRWPSIYKDLNSGGVIWYPEGCSNPVYALGTSLEGYTAANYTEQAFTLETPCDWSMDDRIYAHVRAICTILDLKKNA